MAAVDALLPAEHRVPPAVGAPDEVVLGPGAPVHVPGPPAGPAHPLLHGDGRLAGGTARGRLPPLAAGPRPGPDDGRQRRQYLRRLAPLEPGLQGPQYVQCEPYEKDLIVRFRIDGILYQMFTPPKKFQGAIISRIKIMANLNIAENRLPQDGRFQIKIGGKDIDIRVSIFPTYFGERVVLRLLNKSDMLFDLNSLGFSSETLEVFNSLLEKSHGIILVTGPTGSGKTTTLYSALSRLNKPDVNILTVEDPIEYQIHNIGQMQVKPKIELTFANGLRSILRQDPDIIMIGEIRDLETAEIAVQAALTGHKVFSTLHTNDAASGITRLIDMGVEPFLIASSVNAFLAQRLVRTICPECRESYKPSAKMLSKLNIKPSQQKNRKFYRGRGCPNCLNTGYRGRTGIYELLTVTEDVRKAVLTHAEAHEIKSIAIKEGMITLFEDGTKKVLSGETTIEEVLRVS